MKIALISARRDPFISPYDMDGGCVVLRNYIKELYSLGHDITIFTRFEIEHPNNTDKINEKARLQIKAGIGMVKIKNLLSICRIPYVPSPNENQNVRELEEASSFSKNLAEYLENIDFDIYHYFHLLSIAGWIINNKNIPGINRTVFTPLLLTKGRSFEYPIKDRLHLEEYIFTNIKHIVCQSDGEIKSIVKNYNISIESLHKIPLGVDREIFYPKKDFYLNDTIIVHPASIKPQKRQIESLHILKKLKNDGLKCSLLFIGVVSDFDYKNKIMNQISEYSLSHQRVNYDQFITGNYNRADIYFVDGVREKQLAEVLRLCKISVFPSIDEGFNLSLIDSMACGTLPVCYSIQAYDDYLINNENALTVSINSNWIDIYKIIYNLLLDNDKLVRLSKTAANISNNFSWTNLMYIQLQLYKSILDGQKIKKMSWEALNNWINLND